LGLEGEEDRVDYVLGAMDGIKKVKATINSEGEIDDETSKDGRSTLIRQRNAQGDEDDIIEGSEVDCGYSIILSDLTMPKIDGY